MGAWGSGPFENDDAADWAWELEEAHDHGVLRRALEVATSTRGYFELPDGAAAVAAAAVIASALDGDRAGMSDEVNAYIDRVGRPDAELVELARRALDHVAEDGELAELWDEADDPEWRDGLASLQGRLRS
jgi:hypothetical protein